jgi:hypothetical protein
MNPELKNALRRIVDMYLPDEKKNWLEGGNPRKNTGHIYIDLLIVDTELRSQKC